MRIIKFYGDRRGRTGLVALREEMYRLGYDERISYRPTSIDSAFAVVVSEWSSDTYPQQLPPLQ